MAWFKAALVRIARLVSTFFWKLSIRLGGKIAVLSHGFGMPFEDAFWETLSSRTRTIAHQSKLHGKVTFRTTQINTITNWRAATFSNKEPETLEWIDGFDPDWQFIDVGANVGIYSLYYLAVHKGEVLCVEPSMNNLQQLVINVNVNGFQDRCVIVPNPLGFSDNSFLQLDTKTIQPGSAESSAGGLIDEANLSYRIPSLSLDSLTDNLEGPFALKIDVDGLEAEILQGATRFLASKKCRTLLVENDRDNSKRKQQIEKSLRVAGMILSSESYSELMNSGRTSDQTVNQIWTRDPAVKD